MTSGDPLPIHGNANYQGPGIYKHYKGGKYEVLGIAVKEDTVDIETGNLDSKTVLFVIYRPLSSFPLLPGFTTTLGSLGSAAFEFWAREFDDFNEVILLDRNNSIPRFTKHGNI